MRHIVTAALMFAGAGLATLVAAALVQQWALSRRVPQEPPPFQAVLGEPPAQGDKKSGGECGSAMFQLGSPFATRKPQSLRQE
jgi:hypothetical protein